MKFKSFTLLLLAAILFTNTFSQPIITKQKVVGGKDTEFFGMLTLTKDGGSILGGSSNSRISKDKTDSSRGDYDYWIVKLDSLQNVEWDKTFGGSSEDYLISILQTNDDGYILGGTSSSEKSGEKTENSKGSYDYWIIKINKAGKIEWDRTIGGSDEEWFTSLQQTNDGGYILGGRSKSDSSANKTQNSKGKEDYWIVKLSSSGNIEWDKTIGGRSYDELYALKQTTDGGYILGGWSKSPISGDKTQNGRGRSDYWIVKLDAGGIIEWDRNFGGSEYDQLNSILQTEDGGYILGGFSTSDISGNKTEKSRGYADYWIIKLNSAGYIQWDKTIGGKSSDYLTQINTTKDGGYILGGYSFSDKSGDKTENKRGIYDYWVIKLDSKHNIQWDKTIGGNANDYLYSINETNKNHYILGGESSSGITGDKTKNSKGSSDYWIVYLEDTVNKNTISSLNKISLYNAIIANKTFIAYPNPVKDVLYVQSKSKAVYSLTDQSGKTILTKTIEGKGEINVAALTPGVYFLKNNETGATQKIIVAR